MKPPLRVDPIRFAIRDGKMLSLARWQRAEEAARRKAEEPAK